MHDTASAQHTAEHVRERMFASDRASRTLGIAVESIAPGHATLTMTVREPMLNGHDICHGGFIATLADSAFAYACNAGNQMTVASGFAIDFIASARLGDVLTAQCSEVAKKGRSGVYDTLVSNQHGECIAVFRGRSHTIQGRPAVSS